MSLKKFGIEIEAYASREFVRSFGDYDEFDDYGETPDIMARVLRAQKFESWRADYDDSLEENGFELKSPVLDFSNKAKNFKAIKKLCTIFKDSETFVDDSCGLHVHIDIEKTLIADCMNIIKRYYSFEKELDKIVDSTRRGNTNNYCMTVQNLAREIESHEKDTIRHGNGSVVNKIGYLTKAEKEFYEEKREYLYDELICYGRHFKIAFSDSYSTIEVRHHHSTTDYEEIKNWVLFIKAFCKASEVSLKPGQKDSLWRGISPTLKKYFMERMANRNSRSRKKNGKKKVTDRFAKLKKTNRKYSLAA